MAKKILVVDDEPGMVRLLRDILEDEGYAVIEASNGEECLEKAAKKIPDLILLDVMLTGPSGLSICKRLKDNAVTKDIPIILVTALLGEGIQEKGAESGAAYVISKPYDSNDLLWEIEDAIKKSKV
ncbi:MAG: response regulator [Candidatus Omnitrophica bacterium]|nr:response regulator [Candidatus Omnitrophota bacterium]